MKPKPRTKSATKKPTPSGEVIVTRPPVSQEFFEAMMRFQYGEDPDSAFEDMKKLTPSERDIQPPLPPNKLVNVDLYAKCCMCQAPLPNYKVGPGSVCDDCSKAWNT